MSIHVESVSKLYGNQQALKDVTFTAKKGEIVALLGPNGAGKSTLMKILTGYIKPSEGNVFINQIEIQQNIKATKKNIGYLPEQNPLYQDMYVREYLEFLADIYKASKREVKEVVKKVGLQPEAHKKITQLSKGYKQRVGLAAAILHNPDILILDEPTTGLDPNQLVEIRALIKDLGKDKTVLLSTHIMQEVEAMCHRVLILSSGVLVLNKTIAEINKKQDRNLESIFRDLTT